VIEIRRVVCRQKPDMNIGLSMLLSDIFIVPQRLNHRLHSRKGDVRDDSTLCATPGSLEACNVHKLNIIII